ncbi:myosin IE [Planoprotostelium fungivorum]|uniref:Myosin IE n=1 Tax=Planoprotostelium fungivorum TaxID=1890364 RepID=A0A2P6NWH6_9EUKA|nr:myosin IE [Planoprotostelium fungivorum]
MNLDKTQGGVPDFVLMDQLTEDAMVDNIVGRFKKDNIYTFIGEVVVSMNPYKEVSGLYSKAKMQEYKSAYMYEKSPHIYSLSNNVYRKLLQYRRNQCVIISGESGAGKTEASKVLMQYLAAVSKSSSEVDRVKNQLLESNPVLEAFGNAKTLRNDNSSRFGKYMEIQFDFDGAPVGASIINYLLEKSRVVGRTVGERSFHIFYQMLAGLSDAELKSNGVSKDINQFNYLSVSQCSTVPTINDVTGFKEVQKALDTLGFSGTEKQNMWKILSGILLLGNINFRPDEAKANITRILDQKALDAAAAALTTNAGALSSALTTRSITTGVGKRVSSISIPLDLQAAAFTRDALAKGVYERLFNWLVQSINSRLSAKSTEGKMVVGILDIYGFEVFDNNSFEQFCINFCNEKLQQLFIELTLKSEQEEYVREGIQWEPVKYFNNKIICDLIEGKPVSITSLMDECSLITESTDSTLLGRMNHSFKSHAHFESRDSAKRDMTLPDNSFKLKHYAGDVIYNINGFLEKNKDTLFGDLVNAMNVSSNPLLSSLFPPLDLNSKKRPITAGTQFKNALNNLMDRLLACEPHYIRCIKPNDNKKPGVIDNERLRHQIRYLGLLENVRVRRAGFAFRQPYPRFVWRYKIICPDTWPPRRFTMRPGQDAEKTPAEKIIKHLGLKGDDYRMGKTKVFIRDPRTLFDLETRRDKEIPKVVVKLQTAWRGYIARSQWKQTKAAIKIQLFYRSARSARWMRKVKNAFEGVSRDATYGKNIQWPEPPRVLKNGSILVKKIWANWRARKMVLALTAEQQAEMRQKVLAYTIFSGKKPWDCSRRYQADYLESDKNPNSKKYIEAMAKLFATYEDTSVNFAEYGNKFNSKNKPDFRGIVVTDKNIYKHDPKNYKIKKYETPIVQVTDICLSPFEDTFVIVHAVEPHRDLCFDLGIQGEEKASEFVVAVVQEHKKLTGKTLPIHFKDSITYNAGRTPKGKGVDYTLKFEATDDPKVVNSQIRSKGQVNTVVYSKTNNPIAKKKR